MLLAGWIAGCEPEQPQSDSLDLSGSAWTVFGIVEGTFALLATRESTASISFAATTVEIDTACGVGEGLYLVTGDRLELDAVGFAAPVCPDDDAVAAIVGEHLRDLLTAGTLELVEDRERPAEVLVRRGYRGAYLRRDDAAGDEDDRP